jgi:hypothetical protein
MNKIIEADENKIDKNKNPKIKIKQVSIGNDPYNLRLAG